ncbi:POC1 centriolar protein-like B [Hondaea fermentalgiana]|uniref:POC1 centriolar protein-like B n=1 Tax=Hondaea fermentalgiana TaxID=2315210 RepID=A0A2R5GEU7_9STRA|nr:POC1 centriolar protein-like B [Hondaea fermentalgiana]|eukprot:GBG29437.1 POC1 centriolar protein-like B [Hondaea fermentalgiana]
MARAALPEEFRDLPSDCLERIWDALIDEASGVYLHGEAFDRVFGVIDIEVKVRGDTHAASLDVASAGAVATHDLMPSNTPLGKLFALFQLVSVPDCADAFEVLGALVLASNQLSRREKLAHLQDRCMLVSPLNLASVVNGASLALDGRRVLQEESDLLACTSRELETWLDKFPHRPIRMRVKVLKVSPDVVEEDLRITVNGHAKHFAANGTAEVFAQTGTLATIGAGVIALRNGRFSLKTTKSEQEYAEVLISEHEESDLDIIAPRDAAAGATGAAEVEGITGATETLRNLGMGKDNMNTAPAARKPIEESATLLEAKVDAAQDGEDEEDVAFRARARALATPLISKMMPGRARCISQQIRVWRSAARSVIQQTEDETAQGPSTSRLIATTGFSVSIPPLQLAKSEVVFAVGPLIAIDQISRSTSEPGTTRYFTAHHAQVTALAVHPNGRWVASAAADSRKLLMWDATSMDIQFGIDAVVSGADIVTISKCGSTLFCMNTNEGTYAFYDVSAPGRLSLIRSARLSTEIDARCAEMVSKSSVVLAGTQVVRVDTEGSLRRMRWGKTAPKAVQTSLAALPDGRSFVTASKETGCLYLWSGDVCTKHNVIEGGGSAKVSAVTNDLSRGASVVVCGFDNGTLCLVSSRSLEIVPDSKTPASASETASPVACLTSGASGIIVVTQKSVMWRFSFAEQPQQRWTLMRYGHGTVSEPVLAAWTSSDTFVTAGDSSRVQLWRLGPSNVLVCDGTLCASEHRITALAGLGTRVFFAMGERTITVADFGKTNAKASGSRIVCSSVAHIDELAASEGYLAASCSRSHVIEIRSIPSGVFLHKLSFDPTKAAVSLRFVSLPQGGLALARAQDTAWDTKTWKQLTSPVSTLVLERDPTTRRVVPVGGALLIREVEPIANVSAYQGVRAKELPLFLRRVFRIDVGKTAQASTWATQRGAKTAEVTGGAIVCTNNKSVKALALLTPGRETSEAPILAVATDQGLVQVNNYKLRVEGSTQAVAFGPESRLAVSTSQMIYVFHWKTGVLLTSVAIANEATLGFEFVQVHELGSCLARVTASGGLQIWRLQDDALILDAKCSRPDVGATCLCDAGVFGTLDGYLRRVDDPDGAAVEHARESAILSIHHDKAGFVSADAAGTVKLWSTSLQEIQVRKSERTSFAQPVVAVFRNVATQEVLAQTADGHVYANRNPVDSHLINATLDLPKIPTLAASQRANSKALTFQYKLRGNWRLSVGGDRIRIMDDSLSVMGSFILDDPVKTVALSPDEQVLAVASQANDLYILDVGTMSLVYFWPHAQVLREVEALHFVSEGATSAPVRTGGRALSAMTSPLFATLLVNGAPFAYKT